MRDDSHLHPVPIPEDNGGLGMGEVMEFVHTSEYTRRGLGNMPFSLNPLLKMLGEREIDVDEFIKEVEAANVGLDEHPPTEEDQKWFKVTALDYFRPMYKGLQAPHDQGYVPLAATHPTAANLIMLKYAIATSREKLWADEAKDELLIKQLSVEAMQDPHVNRQSKAQERALIPYKIMAEMLVESIKFEPEFTASIGLSVEGVHNIVADWDALPSPGAVSRKRELYTRLNHMLWACKIKKDNDVATEVNRRINNLLDGHPMSAKLEA